jgi:hypothetical protein
MATKRIQLNMECSVEVEPASPFWLQAVSTRCGTAALTSENWNELPREPESKLFQYLGAITVVSQTQQMKTGTWQVRCRYHAFLDEDRRIEVNHVLQPRSDFETWNLL